MFSGILLLRLAVQTFLPVLANAWTKEDEIPPHAVPGQDDIDDTVESHCDATAAGYDGENPSPPKMPFPEEDSDHELPEEEPLEANLHDVVGSDDEVSDLDRLLQRIADRCCEPVVLESIYNHYATPIPIAENP